MSASSWDEAVPLSAAPAVDVEVPRWSLAKRIAFRFAFCYLVLYALPFPLFYVWRVGALSYEEVWHTIVTAVAKRFFAIDVAIATTGSGDKAYDYVKLLCVFVAAGLGTIVWSILDRRRAAYTRLHEWLRVYVRFTLAATMVSYGAYKVIPAQFAAPGLDRLLQTFGDASPMGLLWTFMGASAAYTIFTGAGEMLGGLLLTTRRTTLLGALVTIAVMANVVALNFMYDVPVKLFSSHLLLMAVFLVLPDVPRLWQFFVAHPPSQLVRAKWLRIGGIVLRTALIGFVIYSGLREAVEGRAEWYQRSPLYGIWNVDTVTVDGVDRPPDIKDAKRWRRIVFDRPDVVAIYPMAGRRTRYLLDLDKLGRIQLKKGDDPLWVARFTYRRTAPDTVLLDGAMDGRNVHAVLKRSNEDKEFRLTTRGFHWINEYPFNR